MEKASTQGGGCLLIIGITRLVKWVLSWAWGPVYKGLHRADSGTRLEMRADKVNNNSRGKIRSDPNFSGSALNFNVAERYNLCFLSPALKIL